MDKNLFGSCSSPTAKNERDFFDLHSLVNKLLLFETFILYSPNLREIPYLVHNFGFEGTLTLLSSGALKISCEVRIAGQTGQSDFLAPGGKSLPLGSYSVAYGYAADRKKWVSDQLKSIGTLDLSKKQVKKLKLAVAGALEGNYLQDFDSKLLQQTNDDLVSNRGIKQATILALKKERQIQANPNDFSIKLHQVDERYFQAETNLDQVFSLDELEVHRIVEKAVLGIAGLNQRIAEMEVHDALSGFSEDEISLFPIGWSSSFDDVILAN